MKKVNVRDAVGMVLCHDITQIIPGKFKGRAFQKGHIIQEEDIEKLLSCGKEHIYVWEYKEGILHENEAAERLRDIVCGDGIEFGAEIKEGKIDFFAKEDGLLKVNEEELFKINSLGEMMVATIHNNTPVKKGEKLGGTRIIPLVIEEEKIKRAEDLIPTKIMEVKKIHPKKAYMITTGSEVYSGKIQDAFGPAVKRKLEEYNCELVRQVILPDDKEKIKEAIKDALNDGAELVMCTGGMSVDPDDMTPTAIKETGAELVTYGSPVLPGAMLLVAYNGDVPILGLPGCVMYNKRTAFDLVLPRVLANEKVTFEDIAKLGHGGFCLNCKVCTFPHCSFGK
ncbi:MAG: molybdopterin-binding protein [Sarcina ventriculi]|uniref:Molybdopterin-binding protein n=2 Tax=Sarcina TaxID=1266 RepID=A0ACD1BFU2_9CLOT|nr:MULTISPECIES: molybdopterin-binding protein [Sarcina]MBU5322930.1 molybdopterin-binding protein [Sarcina ventriculi]MCI5635616.1 molybdopterin-binding protein [Sarcina ventriculi]MDD7373667.1 molybdopterin-binding protein [Sarcina ventriculi]MDY7062038.1 molybdopterin-binding protein [Sarcina ventriculi]QPJ86287.1 molybdopterin-binding protein [Sarcina sp. JB2]